MLGRVLAIATLVAVVLLVIIFYTTVPSTVGPLGVLFVFILLYVVAVGVITFLVYLLSNLFRRVVNSFVNPRRPIGVITFVRAYYFSSVLALGPVMLIGIHSVGRLGLYDVLLVGVFVVISCVYVAKRTQ